MILDFGFWIFDSGLAAVRIGEGETMKGRVRNLLTVNPKSKI
jgi:hypothetical protein